MPGIRGREESQTEGNLIHVLQRSTVRLCQESSPSMNIDFDREVLARRVRRRDVYVKEQSANDALR